MRLEKESNCYVFTGKSGKGIRRGWSGGCDLVNNLSGLRHGGRNPCFMDHVSLTLSAVAAWIANEQPVKDADGRTAIDRAANEEIKDFILGFSMQKA